MRDLKTLLKLMVENIDLIKDFGLCRIAEQMFFDGKINRKELDALFDFLENKLPPHKYAHKDSRIICFSWPPGFKTPRIKWLKKQISKL